MAREGPNVRGPAITAGHAGHVKKRLQEPRRGSDSVEQSLRRLPTLPGRIRGLEDLAYNLWWSWHPAARMLFKRLQRIVWKESGHNPVRMIKDADIEQNGPENRRITAHLYIGDIEQRLRQEIVLGIGGSAVLDALGIRHSVLHLNEGHPAFAILERIRKREMESITVKLFARLRQQRYSQPTPRSPRGMIFSRAISSRGISSTIIRSWDSAAKSSADSAFPPEVRQESLT